MKDIVLRTGDERDEKTTGVSSADVLNTFKAICAPQSKAATVGR
jgi:hypothetical protein